MKKAIMNKKVDHTGRPMTKARSSKAPTVTSTISLKKVTREFPQPKWERITSTPSKSASPRPSAVKTLELQRRRNPLNPRNPAVDPVSREPLRPKVPKSILTNRVRKVPRNRDLAIKPEKERA